MLLIFLFVVLSLAALLWLFRERLSQIAHAFYFGAAWPSFRVAKKTDVAVTMQDGVTLFADLYLPKAKGTFPTIVMKTPYGKNSPEHHYEEMGKLFAGQGLACVIQDVRGKGASEGQFYPHRAEVVDGNDTVQWITEQPWSNKKVAPFGF